MISISIFSSPVVMIAIITLFSFLYHCDAWSVTTPAPVCTRTTTATTTSSALQMSRTNAQRRETRNKFQNNNGMLDFIDEPMNSKEMVGDEILVPPEQDELAELVRCIVRGADGRKADNIVAMRVSKISTVTSFVVIVTGNSRPQNQAIAAVIKDDVNEEFELLPGATGVPEGSADSGWTLLDYGSVMVHVMTPKSRLFYNIEGKWKDQGGEIMDITAAILPNAPTAEQQKQQQEGKSEGESGTMQGLSEEEDPFWS